MAEIEMTAKEQQRMEDIKEYRPPVFNRRLLRKASIYLDLRETRYQRAKQNLKEHYEKTGEWDLSNEVNMEPFLDLVEEINQVKVVDATHLWKLTRIDKPMDELSEILQKAKVSRYERALRRALSKGASYEDLIKIKPKSYGLSRKWGDSLGTDKNSTIQYLLFCAYRLEENSLFYDTYLSDYTILKADTNLKIQKKEPPKLNLDLTAISLHSASQFFKSPKQPTLFSNEKVDDFVKATGMELLKRPESYGVILNQSQMRVFEGIIKAFSDTNYQGNDKIEKITEFSERKININRTDTQKVMSGPYKNIDKIPIIEITQAELIKLSGYERRQEDKKDVTDALNFLATKQFCFYWDRLEKDAKGKPVIDKNGRYKKEWVMEVSTLFRVQYVKEENSQELKNYVISPSAIILDQVNPAYGGSYFLLVPYNWREEVIKLTGKRASSYTYEFLFWLRLQFEHIRRHNARSPKKVPFRISKSWEEIAEILKMPPSMYVRNRARAQKIIKGAIDVALSLGYLVKVENNGATDVLYLNEKYYPKPGELV